MENRWYIQITGADADIGDIDRCLKTYPWSLIKDKDGVYLTNSDLDNISDVDEIRSAAEEFIDTLNGSLRCFYSEYKPISFNSTIEFDRNTGKRSITVHLETIHGETRMRGILTNAGEGKSSSTTVEKWLKASEKSEYVRSALHFFNEPNWWNLYKIYEVIKEDLGGEGNLKSGNYVPSKDLDRFRLSANSRKVLGDKARHADTKNKGPAIPMHLNEAQGLIKQVFEKWIEEKTK